MKQLGVIVVLMLVCVCVFAAESVTVHNSTVASAYPFNQRLVGSLNITASDVPSDALITSNRDHTASFLDLLRGNAALYDCFPEDCTVGYHALRAQPSLTFDLSQGPRTLGFFVNGTNIDITKLNFKINSTFDAGSTVPLRFTFFENPLNEWHFQYFTEDAYHDPDYGYYRSSNANLDYSLGGWTYCNDLIFFETDTVLIGADLYVGNATGFVELLVFNDLGLPLTEGSQRLLYNPHVQNGVKFTSSDDHPFSNAHYYVCIRAYNGTAAEYKLYTDELTGIDPETDENTGEFSGFNYVGEFFDYDAATATRRASYALFIQEAFYAGSEKLTTQAVNFTQNLALADSYLSTKYNHGDCSAGCFVPFVVSGIPQNITLYGVELAYSNSFGAAGNPDLRLYELTPEPALIDYSGVLDLSVLDFVMNKSGVFRLSLLDTELLETQIAITAAPLINGVYPERVPAGIMTRFFADIDYNVTDPDITYEWNFGDGTTMITSAPNVTHLYTNISEYALVLTVRDANLTNTYHTTVSAVNPREYVLVIFNEMSRALNESRDSLASFPTWQQGILRNALDLVNTEDSLRRIKRQIDQAFSDADYLSIAAALQQLDVPRSIFISESYSYDVALTEDANIESFATFTGETLMSDRTREKYIDAIALWQDVNTEFDVSVNQLSLARLSGAVEDIMLVYIVRFANKFGGDAYLVFERPRDALQFTNIGKEPRSEGGLTIFAVNPESTLNLEFYSLGTEVVSFFSAPELQYLVLDADVNENCNFNLICEEGEDYRMCRSDCKPVGLMVVYIILIALGMLIFYTLVQVWYLKYYEDQLFSDKNRLHNLLMYVTAAQQRGMSREAIKQSLRDKGWTLERIDFVIRRANGERIGLYELIPISKIVASRRKTLTQAHPGIAGQPPEAAGPSPARVMPPSSRATSVQQQSRGNINKGSSQPPSTGTP